MGVRKIKIELEKELLGKSKSEAIALIKAKMPEAKISYYENGRGIPQEIIANAPGFHLYADFEKHSRKIEWVG